MLVTLVIKQKFRQRTFKGACNEKLHPGVWKYENNLNKLRFLLSVQFLLYSDFVASFLHPGLFIMNIRITVCYHFGTAEPNLRSDKGPGNGPGDPARKFLTRRKILFWTRNPALIWNSAQKPARTRNSGFGPGFLI